MNSTKPNAHWVAEQLTILAEAFGESMTAQRLMIYAHDLGDIAFEELAAAFQRARRECRFFPKISELRELAGAGLSIGDGRPGVETAWSMCPKTEDESTVWTDEMAVAFGNGARQLLREGDQIAARMAFRETYSRLVEQGRREGAPIRWIVSLGWDRADRVHVLTEAVEPKQITAESAADLLGPAEREQLFMALPAPTSTKLLPPGEARSILPTLPGFAGLLQQMRIEGQVPQGCDSGPPKPEYRPMSKAELVERRQLLQKQAEMLVKKATVT